MAAIPVRIANFPCAMVRLPPPVAAPECHYVALVLHVDLSQGRDAPPPENPTLSYYTLERGIEMDGTERTVVCGWNEAGTHLNYGDGPPTPDLNAFAEAVTRLVGRGGREVHAAFDPGIGGNTPKGA